MTVKKAEKVKKYLQLISSLFLMTCCLHCINCTNSLLFETDHSLVALIIFLFWIPLKVFLELFFRLPNCSPNSENVVLCSNCKATKKVWMPKLIKFSQNHFCIGDCHMGNVSSLLQPSKDVRRTMERWMNWQMYVHVRSF